MSQKERIKTALDFKNPYFHAFNSIVWDMCLLLSITKALMLMIL